MRARNVAVVTASVALIGATPFFAPETFVQKVFAPARVTFARAAAVVKDAPPTAPRVEHQPIPESVKALYMSQCAASTQDFRKRLITIADTTEINSIIVDLKDYSGTVSFPSDTAIPGGKGCTVPDFRDLVKLFHEHGIYVIGRMTVFQDPVYTAAHPEHAVQRRGGGVWHDHKGLAFVDVGATPFWEYIIELSREAHALGVDEINYDYVRYPSDGPMQEAVYSHTTEEKQVSLERFFSHLHVAMKVEQDGHTPVTSADLFGMTTTNYDDLNIGQVIERAFPYFDYIAPMVYPSHYPKNFNGWANPNEHVYGVVHFSMVSAAERATAATTSVPALAYERIGTSTPAVYAKPRYPKTMLRSWIQDFDYGGDYGPKEVRDQIQATYDAGLTSWMVWAPSNRYTTEAFLAQ